MLLDPAQAAVVALPDAASGVVVGAPGSGKTTAIVARVRALLTGGLAADQVLVLTPTRQTATELRDRLALAVRIATPGPLARSVAAFAYQLVRAHAVHAGLEPPQLLTGPDEDRIVQDLLDGDAEDEREGAPRWPAGLGADVRGTAGFRAELRAFVAECTTLGIEPARLADLAAHTGLPASTSETWRALASFLADYHAVRGRMRGAHRDAAGLVREAVGLARTLPVGSPAWGPTGRIRVLLVEDAQELTEGGVDLLDAFRATGVAVLAFGDPDLGSGSFRGARPENFARLAAGLPVHVLDGAHRGTASMRALSDDVAARIGAVGVVAHRRPPSAAEPTKAADGSVRAFTLRSAAEQYDVVARLLRERHIHDGVPWERCAVIAHDSRQVAALARELAARDVPTATGQTRSLGETRAVRDLLTLVELAARGESDDITGAEEDGIDEALRAGGLDAVDVRRLRTALRHDALRSGDPEAPVPAVRALLASGFRHPLEFELLDTREGRRAARVARTVADLRTQLREGATAHELLWTAWERSGWERSWREAASGHGSLADQARRDLDAVVALFQAAKRHGERADGTSPISFVRSVLESEVAEDRLAADLPSGVVSVLTPAAAVGTEFDTVVVAGVQDGVWPNLRTRGGLFETWRLASIATDAPADVLDLRRTVLHDELRLFLRATSRADARLIVTAVVDDDNGPSPFFELLPGAEAAPRGAEHPLSLRGLVARYRRVLTDGRAGAGRGPAAAQLALLAAARVPGASPDEWYGIAPVSSTGPLYDLDAEAARVSPSKLEAIDECQLNWVIGDLGGDSGSVGAGLGTLIHAALEVAEGADEEALWAAVESRWDELEFAAAWIERTERTRARDLVARLAAYLSDAQRAGTTLLDAEPHFELAVPVAGAAHPAVISGTIDRVELTAEGTVVIVDLKTGRTQATGPSAAVGNPQLSAYQLAFERGAVPGTDGRVGGGAKLLVLKPTRGAAYATPAQPPFDDDTRAQFLERIGDAVRVMGESEFLAPYEAHCRDDHTHGVCRIHTIGAVSAS